MFANRTQGGQLLAAALERYRHDRPLVLGVANGGVPVARVVADHFGVPVDVLVVRRFGFSARAGRALGVITEGGVRCVNWAEVRERGLREAEVAALAEPAIHVVTRRVELYRRGRALPEMAGRTVLVVDDAVATGTSARAACSVARGRGAARVVLAAPVVAALVEPQLHAAFDDVVAIDRPLRVVLGSSYRDAAPVSEEEVLACLERGHLVRESSEEPWSEDWFGVPAEPMQ